MSATIVRDTWAEFVRAGKLGDAPDERDEEFWDEVERRLAASVEEAIHWREVLHPRDRRGKFRDVPGRSSPAVAHGVEATGKDVIDAIERAAEDFDMEFATNEGTVTIKAHVTAAHVYESTVEYSVELSSDHGEEEIGLFDRLVTLGGQPRMERLGSEVSRHWQKFGLASEWHRLEKAALNGLGVHEQESYAVGKAGRKLGLKVGMLPERVGTSKGFAMAGKLSPGLDEERAQAIDRIEAAIDRDGEPALVAFAMRAVAGALGALGFELADASEHGDTQVTSWIHPTGGVLHLESRDQMVSSSTWDPNRVEAQRAEGPLKSFEELRADTIALARELAERHHAETKLRGFGVNDELSDTAGLHEWNGDASIGPDALDVVEQVGSMRKHREEVPEDVIAPYWFANQVAAHEISHSVNPISFSTYHANVGRALEEALTEEASHLIAADRMRERGELDVLAWYRDNRAHPYGNGTYHAERLALTRIFDRMKVAPEHRREFIMELKFEIPPEDRIDVLGEGLLAAGLSEGDAVELLRALDIDHPFNRTREAEERLGPFNVVPDLEGLPESEPTRIGFGKNVYEVGQEIDIEGYGRSRVRDGNGEVLLVQTPHGLLRMDASDVDAIVRTHPPRTLGDGEAAIAVGDAVEYRRPDGGWTRGRLVRVHRSEWEDYLAEVRVGDQTVLISSTSTRGVRKVANATTMPPR